MRGGERRGKRRGTLEGREREKKKEARIFPSSNRLRPCGRCKHLHYASVRAVPRLSRKVKNSFSSKGGSMDVYRNQWCGRWTWDQVGILYYVGVCCGVDQKGSVA